MIVYKIIFWVFLLLIAHSYLFYPLWLRLIIVIRGSNKYQQYKPNEILPSVAILMAAYNEESVIEKKINSIIETSYPQRKIELLIGSDNSTDKTNQIVEHLAKKYTNIHFRLFTERQGKIKIINQLIQQTSCEIIFITDANVLFNKDTIFNCVKLYKDQRVGLVDTNMQNYGIKHDGISMQEGKYISWEVSIKDMESRAGGAMIGPFGGCYSLRKALYKPVPENFLVDDFFICLNVLAQGKHAINCIDAIVYEDVSNNLLIEFKRKIRIATGNFQNLKQFGFLLWPPFTAIAFFYLSHKVLRWLGPFFLIGILLSNIALAFFSTFYFYVLLLQLFVLILPFTDIILKQFKIHIVFLRFATHFFTMNLSLLVGFVKYLKGVKTNVWIPTKRFQQ